MCDALLEIGWPVIQILVVEGYPSFHPFKYFTQIKVFKLCSTSYEQTISTSEIFSLLIFNSSLILFITDCEKH